MLTLPPNPEKFTHKLHPGAPPYVECDAVKVPPLVTDDWSRVDCPVCRKASPGLPGSGKVTITMSPTWPSDLVAVAVALANRVSELDRPGVVWTVCPGDVLNMLDDIRRIAGGKPPTNDWQHGRVAPGDPSGAADLLRLWGAFRARAHADNNMSIRVFEDGSGRLVDGRDEDVTDWNNLAEGCEALAKLDRAKGA